MGRPVNKRNFGLQGGTFQVSRFRRIGGTEDNSQAYIRKQDSSNQFWVSAHDDAWTELLTLVDKDEGLLDEGEFVVEVADRFGAVYRAAKIQSRTLVTHDNQRSPWNSAASLNYADNETLPNNDVFVIDVFNSTVSDEGGIITGPDVISFGQFTGAGRGGVAVPVGATSISNDGGTNLEIAGGLVVPTTDATVTAGTVVFDNGDEWTITIVPDAASLGTDGDIRLEILRLRDSGPVPDDFILMLRPGDYPMDSPPSGAPVYASGLYNQLNISGSGKSCVVTHHPGELLQPRHTTGDTRLVFQAGGIIWDGITYYKSRAMLDGGDIRWLRVGGGQVENGGFRNCLFTTDPLTEEQITDPNPTTTFPQLPTPPELGSNGIYEDCRFSYVWYGPNARIEDSVSIQRNFIEYFYFDNIRLNGTDTDVNDLSNYGQRIIADNTAINSIGLYNERDGSAVPHTDGIQFMSGQFNDLWIYNNAFIQGRTRGTNFQSFINTQSNLIRPVISTNFMSNQGTHGLTVERSTDAVITHNTVHGLDGSGTIRLADTGGTFRSTGIVIMKNNLVASLFANPFPDDYAEIFENNQFAGGDSASIFANGVMEKLDLEESIQKAIPRPEFAALGAYDSNVEFRTNVLGPQIPTDASATGASGTFSVTLTPPADNGNVITGYEVWYRPDGSTDNDAWVVETNYTLGANITAAANTYEYRVAAVNANGQGQFSLSDTVTVS